MYQSFLIKSCLYLSSISPSKGTYPPAMHLASLESHHRRDLPRAPSLVVTVFSRSTWDGTQVSLFLLPVIAHRGCAVTSKTNRLRRTDVRRSPAFVACRLPDSRKNVKDMLIFNFQGTGIVCLIEAFFALYYSLYRFFTTKKTANYYFSKNFFT